MIKVFVHSLTSLLIAEIYFHTSLQKDFYVANGKL